MRIRLGFWFQTKNYLNQSDDVTKHCKLFLLALNLGELYCEFIQLCFQQSCGVVVK